MGVLRMTNAELIAELRGHILSVPLTLLRDAADALEAADKRIAELEAQLPKDGEWIEQDDGDSIFFKCSVCGKIQYNVLLEMMQGEYHYCPNCGAKMDGGTEHGNTYSLGKIEMPKGAIEQIIADGERSEKNESIRIARKRDGKRHLERTVNPMNELIDSLRWNGKEYKGSTMDEDDKKLYRDAADAIERLTAEVDRKDKALQAWVKIWEQTKDKLIRRICSHCDSVLVGCEGCPVVGEVRAVFDEQQT